MADPGVPEHGLCCKASAKSAHGRTDSGEGGRSAHDAVTYEHMSKSQAGGMRVSGRSNKMVLKDSVSCSSPLHP